MKPKRTERSQYFMKRKVFKFAGSKVLTLSISNIHWKRPFRLCQRYKFTYTMMIKKGVKLNSSHFWNKQYRGVFEPKYAVVSLHWCEYLFYLEAEIPYSAVFLHYPNFFSDYHIFLLLKDTLIRQTFKNDDEYKINDRIFSLIKWVY